MAGESNAHEEPAWFATFKDKLIKLEKLYSDISRTPEQVDVSLKLQSEKVKSLTEENAFLKQEVATLRSRIINMEAHSRRENLLFDEINDTDRETWENCENKLRDFLKNNLNLDTSHEIRFERVHRLGPFTTGKCRTIIAKFSFFKEREIVWRNRTTLKDTKFWILEDYPQEVQRSRKVLYPILREAQKEAKRPNSGIKKVSLSMDILNVNGRKYTVSDLNDLPECIRPGNIAVRSTGDATVFFSRNSVLSNFYMHSPFTIHGIKYNCAEQFYQKTKAEHFKDDSAASAIMRSRDPADQYRIGQKIRGYVDREWMKRAQNVLVEANMAKYEQNKHVRDVLINTGSRKLGEASTSKVWGIGLKLKDPNAVKIDLWNGQNIMGEVLTVVRNRLQSSVLK